MTAKNKVHETYESHNVQDLAQQYEQWAKDYDQDMDEVYGAKDRMNFAKVMVKYVSKEANILDTGAGDRAVRSGLTPAWLPQLNRNGYIRKYVGRSP